MQQILTQKINNIKCVVYNLQISKIYNTLSYKFYVNWFSQNAFIDVCQTLVFIANLWLQFTNEYCSWMLTDTLINKIKRNNKETGHIWLAFQWHERLLGWNRQ